MPDRASRTKVVGLIAWWKVFPARVRIGTGQVAAGLLGNRQRTNKASKYSCLPIVKPNVTNGLLTLAI